MSHPNEPNLGLRNTCHQGACRQQGIVGNFILSGIHVNRYDLAVVSTLDFLANREVVDFVAESGDLLG